MNAARKEERPTVADLWAKWQGIEGHNNATAADPEIAVYREQEQIERDMILTESTGLLEIRFKLALLKDYMDKGSPPEHRDYLLLTSIDRDLSGLR